MNRGFVRMTACALACALACAAAAAMKVDKKRFGSVKPSELVVMDVSGAAVETNDVQRIIERNVATNYLASYEQVAGKISLPDPEYVGTNYFPLSDGEGDVVWTWYGGGGGGSLGKVTQVQDQYDEWHNVRGYMDGSGNVTIVVDPAIAQHEEMTVQQERSRATTAELKLGTKLNNEILARIVADEGLQEQINSISSLGRFISTWNTETGMPSTEPSVQTLEYLNGDYYIVGSVSTNEPPWNLIPHGSYRERGSKSTCGTNEVIYVNDVFRYAGEGQWTRVIMKDVSVMWQQITGEPTNSVKLVAAITNLSYRVVTNTVDKGYVEGLGIDKWIERPDETVTNGFVLVKGAHSNETRWVKLEGCDTNRVNDLIREYDVTNLTPRIENALNTNKVNDLIHEYDVTNLTPRIQSAVQTNEYGFIMDAKILSSQVIDVYGMCFTAVGTNVTITMKSSIISFGDLPDIYLQYSRDGHAWNTFVSNRVASVVTLTNAGDRVWIKAGWNNDTFRGEHDGWWFSLTGGKVEASESIEFLRRKDGRVSALLPSCYESLFRDCNNLTRPPTLPATDLADECYSGMFSKCRALTVAPELPATTLKTACYAEMFRECESLLTPPSLPAKSLSYGCYAGMFDHCTLLMRAPVLNASALEDRCYDGMFSDCKALTEAPSLIATTMKKSCYENMFTGCDSLVSAPALNSTNLAEACYRHMFLDCKSLKIPPSLPAAIMAEDCYDGMFARCKSLTSAPKLDSASILAEGCFSGMFDECYSLTDVSDLNCKDVPEFAYSGMFEDCRSMITPPKISATNLMACSCQGMFKGCSSITEAPIIRATVLGDKCCYRMFVDCAALNISEICTNEYVTPYRIPSVGSAVSVGTDSLTDMFAGTGGTFTGTPAVNTTYYGAWSLPYYTKTEINSTSVTNGGARALTLSLSSVKVDKPNASVPAGYVATKGANSNEVVWTQTTSLSTVTGVVQSAAVTNAGAVASAKAYADGTFLPLDGGTMTGNIFLSNEKSVYFNGYENDSGIILNDFGLCIAGEDEKIKFIIPSIENVICSDLTPDNSPVVTSNMLNGVLTPALAQKADLAVPSAANNFAALDARGNLADSGKKASDFATATALNNYLPLDGSKKLSGTYKSFATNVGSDFISGIEFWENENDTGPTFRLYYNPIYGTLKLDAPFGSSSSPYNLDIQPSADIRKFDGVNYYDYLTSNDADYHIVNEDIVYSGQIGNFNITNLTAKTVSCDVSTTSDKASDILIWTYGNTAECQMTFTLPSGFTLVGDAADTKATANKKCLFSLVKISNTEVIVSKKEYE